MTSVEVLAAAKLVRGLPEEVGGTAGLPIVVNTLETIAGRLAKVEKASEEAAALAAYGGVAAAEAGWNALRQHNPKVDRSTGDRDINAFDELPHALKLNYAAFAFGVLNPGAKLGSDVPVESYRFKGGDKVRITGPVQTTTGGICFLQGGEIATVVNPVPDIDGDISVSGKLADCDEVLAQWIDPASLTLVREPREFLSLDDVPDGVRFAEKADPEWSWERREDGKYSVFLRGVQRAVWRDVGQFAPFVEVIA